MKENNVNEKNIKEYCRRHNINGGIFDNIAVTFETIQNSLEKILSANKNNKLIKQLSKDKFIEESETSDKNLALSSHYFSNFFADMSLLEDDFNDAINDQENEDYKMIIGLFKTYSSNDYKTNLMSADRVAFGIIKSIDTKIQSLISGINKIESAKNKVTNGDIINVFQQFQQINNTISGSNYLFARKGSLLELVNRHWEIEEKEETKNKNNELPKTNAHCQAKENIKADANSNTHSSVNSTHNINAKTDRDKCIKSLTYIIKNNAPDMIKDIKSIEEQIDKNTKLKEAINFYGQNIEKRNQYTLLNPLDWISIWNLMEERKQITANILGVCADILNGKNGETKGTKINNLNEKLVDISKENLKTNNKTKSLDNKERKDEIIFKNGSCVIDNSSKSQKPDEK